ncbi:hypothetical protein K443DRAFT_682953 [Laccaria amethystina LaAM-08-1]|uniref:Unplaced genomic scaffold K443scaffold_218, whole genome shotgun sequence n=1 Tax=Laccaria amethystina LaAM-08-1 TaxID=1095629 RepID=A0A0C9X2U5_9AGAR|nr:hypothetical protein K443DRAFT_682953 [Laccaria amethystina LaAM-08-1]
MPTQEDGYDGPNSGALVAQPEPQPQLPPLEGQELFKMNAKFFLFDVAAVKWNVFGTGSIILLLEKDKKTASVIMKSRTKIYANFTITGIELQLSMGSKETRALVCRVPADSSRICDQTQTLAFRFVSEDYASRFKTVYRDAQKGSFNLQDGSAGLEKPKQSHPHGLDDGRD